MKNKFTEKQLFDAYKGQDSAQLNAAFIAKVMQSVQTESIWQPVFKFAAFNVCLASICAIFGFFLFDLNDLGLQLIVDSGIVI